MSPKEALDLLENTCVVFMINIQRSKRKEILEAADVLRELVDKNKPREGSEKNSN